MDWSPGSWRQREARQQPAYRDPAALAAAERALAGRPPLVALAEIDALAAALARAQAGRAFLLQAGDCAERFDAPPDELEADLGLLRAMTAAVAAAAGLAVVAVGRIAGQFAKPRSQESEARGGIALPAWRGDLVNGAAFDAAARRPDPARMLRGYDAAAATLARLRREPSPVFAGHEALLLPYEQALTRRDPASGRVFAGSAHFLWIGERTRFAGSAHVEFARGIANPIGVKCGPGLDPDGLLRLLDALDPDRRPGRIALIARMGRDRIGAALPPLMRAAGRAARPVLWVCDPMHGNTVRGPGGRKARPLDAIVAEARAFFAIAAAEGAAAGGLHVETTTGNVLECAPAPEAAVAEPPCDPRLNAGQALDLAALAGRMAGARGRAAAPARAAG